MKALYRKYRPTKLSDVVGQEQVTKNLESSLKRGRLSHAYLFIGPRGCGKTSVARIFAHEINGFNYELEDFYPDILEIDAASNTGVDNIRELRERAAIAPAEGKYKVYIIDEVHMLSKSAFNALLKTLEEPPAHVVFIMATTDVYKVPPTIISRSEVYEFRLSSPEVMQAYLKKIAEKEGIKITDDALALLTRRGGGSFRDSLSLLDQVSTIADGEISAELISSSLGLPSSDKIDRLLDAYRAGSLADISESLKALLSSGVRAEIIAEDILDTILASPSPDLLPLLKPLSSVANPFPEAKLLLAFTEDSPVNSTESFQPKGSTNNKEISPREITTSAGLSPELEQSGIWAKARPDVVISKGETISRSENPLVENSVPELSWSAFYSAVQQQSPSLADILNKTTQKIANNTITLIPEKKIYKTILTSKNNAEILKKCLPENYELQVLDPDDTVISTNDPQISKLSAIMGGKVMEVNDENGGNNPF
ncbi:DNA polymerase III subunit gamma/tau [Candidatus Saccharibacteria bacterium]|nr:DNA polymerase III subunit gamma/tau [Candidatus Saccharibacteria bacterium]